MCTSEGAAGIAAFGAAGTAALGAAAAGAVIVKCTDTELLPCANVMVSRPGSVGSETRICMVKEPSPSAVIVPTVRLPTGPDSVTVIGLFDTKPPPDASIAVPGGPDVTSRLAYGFGAAGSAGAPRCGSAFLGAACC